MSCRRTMFANVSCQQPRRPQFVRIAEILGFTAGKIDNESSRFFGDDPLASRSGLSSRAATTPNLSARRKHRSTV